MLVTILTASLLGLAQAIPLTTNDTDSIKGAAAQIAYDMLKTWYTGNVTGGDAVGLLPSPYYWWEAGAMWGGLVDYSFYTNDTSYDETVGAAIASQASNTTDFMKMDTQAFDLGNDDQAYWALTSMSAAENNFPVPSGSPPQLWYNLSKNAFNDLYYRWNTSACNGGLKWQFQPQNNGFYYKSSITNGAFFQLAARLARYTGNTTYSDAATRTFEWMQAVNFINPHYLVFDGAGDDQNCSVIDTSTWSYNTAVLIHGAATMYAITGDQIWADRANGLVAAASGRFFGPTANTSDIMYEYNCEVRKTCDTDQLSFKAYMGRWMGKATQMMPSLAGITYPLLSASAAGAAQACAGGSTGTMCGEQWFVAGSDGSQGVGQQMSAMETIQALLVLRGQTPMPGTLQSQGMRE